MFVEHGNGATTGMTPEQHSAFARGRQEDVVTLSTEDREGMRESVAFESELGTEEVDTFRRGVAQRWLPQEAALNSARSAVLRFANLRSEQILKRIRTSLARQLVTDTPFQTGGHAPAAVGQRGVPLVGPLPRCEEPRGGCSPSHAAHRYRWNYWGQIDVQGMKW